MTTKWAVFVLLSLSKATRKGTLSKKHPMDRPMAGTIFMCFPEPQFSSLAASVALNLASLKYLDVSHVLLPNLEASSLSLKRIPERGVVSLRGEVYREFVGTSTPAIRGLWFIGQTDLTLPCMFLSSQSIHKRSWESRAVACQLFLPISSSRHKRHTSATDGFVKRGRHATLMTSQDPSCSHEA